MELSQYIENIKDEIDDLETFLWVLSGENQTEDRTIERIVTIYESTINEIKYSMDRIKSEYGNNIPNKKI